MLKRLIVVSVVFGTVGSDECTDFCSLVYPHELCATGVSCVDGVCTGLVSSYPEGRLFLTSNSIRPSAHNISCEVAQSFVSNSSYISQAPSVQEASGSGSVHTTSSPTAVQSGANLLYRIFTSVISYFSPPSQNGTISYLPTELEEDYVSSSLAASKIGIHYNMDLSDIRPRLNVTFLCEREIRQRSFLLDTASDKYLYPAADLFANGSATASQCADGYLLLEETLPAIKPELVRFGSGKFAIDLQVTHLVREVALLTERPGHSTCGYSFPLALSLTTSSLSSCETNPGIDRGVFGASLGSDFSNSVNSFSFIPQIFNRTENNIGVLAINDIDYASQLCESELRYFPTDPKLPLLWAVDGYISMGGKPMSPVSFILDTGATNVYVTEFVYTNVLEAIRKTGSFVRGDSAKTLVSFCRFNMAAFPTISFVISHEIVLDLKPVDYLVNFSLISNSCELNIAKSAIHGREDVRLLGMRFLNKFITVFDRENRRVGMCRQEHLSSRF